MKAFSKSTGRRHRLSFVDDGFTAILGSEPLRYCVVSSEPVVWHGFRCETTKSFSDSHWPMAIVLLLQGCERGAGDPRGNGSWNVALGHGADRGMEATHHFISATWEEATYVLWAEARRSGFRIRRTGLQGVLNRSEGLWRGRLQQSGEVSWQSLRFEVAGDELVSPWHLSRRSRWFVQ